ncbi:MAG: FAD-binding oxidoreductase [Gammaproteobacteria bacterium]|nr:FAD-binding oxidoreductase [Gammaproteobacteria bacterium]
MALIDTPDRKSPAMITDLRRRDVLRQLGALGVTGTIGQLYLGSLFARPGQAAPGLDRLVTGEVVNRDDDQYEAWRNSMVWHLRKPARYPDAIMRAQSEQDVISAVKYATDNGLKVSTRSSGHNSTGAALRDSGLLIDLALLRDVEIDAGRKTARVQPALWSEQLVREAGKHGLAFPAAHCPTVALGGYLLGGGAGWNHAHWGSVACHSIKSADVILAGGRKVTASAASHPDLYWAVRGVGPGFFGIVTGFELQLYPLPGAIYTSMYIAPLDELQTVVDSLDELNRVKDERVEILVLLMHNPQAPGDTPHGEAKVCMVGVQAFADTETEAKTMLAPFANSELASASVFKVEQQPSSFTKLYNPENVDSGIGRYAVDNVWTDDPGQALLSVAEHFKNTPSARTHVLCSYGIKAELRDDACFSRIANHYIASYLLWNDADNDEANHAWLKQTNDLLQPYSKGTYINEIEATLFPERVRSCFSDESWARLAELRKKYDPDNVFHTWLGYA